MEGRTKAPERTIGVDVGDRYSHVCILDGSGEVIEEARVRTTQAAVHGRFRGMAPARVVLEVGAHSPWVSRELAAAGHEVIVANPRKLRLIYESDRKSDRADAEYLARVGRLDPKLLAPIEHRSEDVQADLAVIRSRDALVDARTALINHARSTVKAIGGRLPPCSTDSFHRTVEEHVPEALVPALVPVIDTVAQLTAEIGKMERWIRELAETQYPETVVLCQVAGVGTLTALCYMLTLESPDRFRTSRAVGPYLGLVPRRHESGESSPELRALPNGSDKIVIDRFHVAQHLNQAVDRTRRAEHRALSEAGDDRLKATRYIWIKGRAKRRLSEELRIERLRKSGLKVGRAWALKEAIRALWTYRSRAWALKFFRRWYAWVC